ncbi:hypothetical protein [Vibrio hepatarius]|uniref:hypothetical protein n=1 Tax=Vibrio hepatarius TaxID=171383 RepID=UPI003735AA78
MAFIQSLWGPNGLILLGAIISAIGVLWSSNIQTSVNEQLTEKTRQISEKNETISSVTNELHDKSNQLIQASQKLNEKNDQLIEKSEVIENLNEEIIAFSTGGDSFPIVEFTSLDPIKNGGQLMITNGSNRYPIFDLSVRIVDLASKKPRTIENPLADDHILNIGTISASTSYMQGYVTLGGNVEKSFTVQSNSRHGHFIQSVRLRKVAGQWKSATKVSRMTGNSPLYTKVDEGFPLNSDGEVSW